MLAAMGLTGLTLGMFQAAYFYTVTDEFPRSDRGVAGSLVEMTRSMGFVTAASLLFELFRIISKTAAAGGAAPDAAFQAGYQTTFHLAAAISVVVFALVLLASKAQGTGANTKPTG